MNKKILLGSIFTISIIGMAHAETTDLNAIIGTVAGDDYDYDSSTMTFSVNYGDLGSITGRAQCSNQGGVSPFDGTGEEITVQHILSDDTGRYCYCALDGYTPLGGEKQNLSAAYWVYNLDHSNVESCQGSCVFGCAFFMQLTEEPAFLKYRSLIFSAVETPIIIITPSTISCELGYYLPAGTTECAICPANSYCAGGEYEKSEIDDSGILPCDSGLISPTGMWQAEQCGHALHIGDSVLYLRQTKQTEHALHIQHGNDIFYGNATTADVPMNINTNHRLKVEHNNVIYSIYDDTIQLEN